MVCHAELGFANPILPRLCNVLKVLDIAIEWLIQAIFSPFFHCSNINLSIVPSAGCLWMHWMHRYMMTTIKEGTAI